MRDRRLERLYRAVYLADLRRLADALERAADGDAVDVKLGPLTEQLRLRHASHGSLVLELRGDLRPWDWEETNEVARFELEAKADELRQAARNLRLEVRSGWISTTEVSGFTPSYSAICKSIRKRKPRVRGFCRAL